MEQYLVVSNRLVRAAKQVSEGDQMSESVLTLIEPELGVRAGFGPAAGLDLVVEFFCLFEAGEVEFHRLG
jgi:hypothetical protein